MPRPRQFERVDALDAVFQTFWTQGYERTSITDLVKASGASRYSLYEEFGDKDALYEAALDHYRDRYVSMLLGDLTEEDASLQDLVAYFDRLIGSLRQPGPQLGCFMVRTAGDPLVSRREAQEKVQAHFARMRRTFGRALANAQRKGEWPADRDAHRTAQMLVGIVQGASLFIWAGEPPDRVREYLEHSLETIL